MYGHICVDDQNIEWLLAIKLAHGFSKIHDREISDAVMEKALLIVAYVKDYLHLEVLVQKKLNLYTQDDNSSIVNFQSYQIPLFFYAERQQENKKNDVIAIQYARYGYLQGLQKLINDCESKSLLIVLLKESVKYSRPQIVFFLLNKYSKSFSEEIIQSVFCEASDIEVVECFFNKKKVDITSAVIQKTIENIIERNQGFDVYPQLDIISFLLNEDLPVYILDSIFLFAIKNHSNSIINLFIKIKREYVLERADTLFPMIAEIGGYNVLEFLLSEKGIDIGSEVIVEAFFEIVKNKHNEFLELFKFLMRKRPEILKGMLIEQITELLFLAIENRHLSILDALLESEVRGTVNFIDVFLGRVDPLSHLSRPLFRIGHADLPHPAPESTRLFSPRQTSMLF